MHEVMQRTEALRWTEPAFAVKIESRDCLSHFPVVVETEDPARARAQSQRFLRSDDYVYEVSPIESGTQPMGGPVYAVLHADRSVTEITEEGVRLRWMRSGD